MVVHVRLPRTLLNSPKRSVQLVSEEGFGLARFVSSIMFSDMLSMFPLHFRTTSFLTISVLKFEPVHIITKACLYNIDPLRPHYYKVKLGFTGVYIIFLLLPKNIDLGYSLEPPRRGGSSEYQQSIFWAEIWKNFRIFIWKFSFFGGKIFSIFK